MKATYRAFREGASITALYSSDSEADARAKGLLAPDAELLWSIEADTPEEATAIYPENFKVVVASSVKSHAAFWVWFFASLVELSSYGQILCMRI